MTNTESVVTRLPDLTQAYATATSPGLLNRGDVIISGDLGIWSQQFLLKSVNMESVIEIIQTQISKDLDKIRSLKSRKWLQVENNVFWKIVTCATWSQQFRRTRDKSSWTLPLANHTSTQSASGNVLQL